MIDKPLVSIVIRTKNEERWITQCLKSVTNQSYSNIEIIIVDNNSSDDTVRRARQFPVKLISVSHFKPGNALNEGIRISNGDIIVCLSAHCVPIGENWLSALVAPLEDDQVAGVYGRQEPTNFSSDLDKRDLITVFRLDKIVQIKDPFFHNANSAFRRRTWERCPFDENVTNLEDRVWGQQVIDLGMTIIYEPSATVTHWHGIHQGMDLHRARGVMKVIESVAGSSLRVNSIDPTELNVVAIIPVRASSISESSKLLLKIAIDSCKKSEYISRTVVSTDDEEIMKLSVTLGAEAPFLRPEYLSKPEIDIFDVVKFSLDQLELKGEIIDIVVVLETTYPFRPNALIDMLIQRLVSQGLDTVIAGKPEKRSIWSVNESGFNTVVEPFMPRHLKVNSGIIGLVGLGLACRPDTIRSSGIFESNIGIIEIIDEFSSIEVRNEEQVSVTRAFIDLWSSMNVQ